MFTKQILQYNCTITASYSIVVVVVVVVVDHKVLETFLPPSLRLASSVL